MNEYLPANSFDGRTLWRMDWATGVVVASQQNKTLTWQQNK